MVWLSIRKCRIGVCEVEVEMRVPLMETDKQQTHSPHYLSCSGCKVLAPQPNQDPHLAEFRFWGRFWDQVQHLWCIVKGVVQHHCVADAAEGTNKRAQ